VAAWYARAGCRGEDLYRNGPPEWKAGIDDPDVLYLSVQPKRRKNPLHVVDENGVVERVLNGPASSFRTHEGSRLFWWLWNARQAMETEWLALTSEALRRDPDLEELVRQYNRTVWPPYGQQWPGDDFSAVRRLQIELPRKH
jgi:hypothetical protein